MKEDARRKGRRKVNRGHPEIPVSLLGKEKAQAQKEVAG